MTACVKRFVPSRHALLAVIVTLAAVPTGVASAADFGAIVPVGNWVTAANWNRASAPLAGDNVFIGSTTPGGSATTSAITLTQNHAASNVYLGYGNATAGTLQLGNFALTADSLTLGANGTGTGVVGRGTGTLTVAGAIAVNTAGTFAFAAGDVTSTLNLTTNSTATTAAAGNITNRVGLGGGSTLTLTNNLALGGFLEVAGSTLSAQGHDITATNGIYLYDAAAVITSRGKITTNYFQVVG